MVGVRNLMVPLPPSPLQVAQREHMDAVFGFLGVRNLTEPEWGTVMSMPVKNVGKDKSEMLPETRKLLSQFYAPYNAMLAKLLNDDRYLWQS